MLRYVAKTLLWLGGWTAVGSVPSVKKAVIIAAPHTSNWDAVWALIYKVSIGLDIRFFGKHTVFWFPLGQVLAAMGAVPLNRAEPGAAITRAVDEFSRNESFYFGLAPEGTRRWRPYWKSGFYRIAQTANVPVVLGFFDFATKRIGLGPTITLTGNENEDLAEIREFYSNITGCRPENASPVIFSSDE